MTGDYATFGQQMTEGTEQAVADLKAEGGGLGRKPAPSIGDDPCDPRQTVSVANDMANKGIDSMASHFYPA